MHELGLTAELVRIVDSKAAEAGAKKVISVSLVIGAFSGVEAEAVEFCFGVVAKGTRAEGAVLNIERVPLTIRCGSCSKTATPEHGYPFCPDCGSAGVEIVAGREFTIRNMEVE